jgi:hypothetical protein
MLPSRYGYGARRPRAGASQALGVFILSVAAAALVALVLLDRETVGPAPGTSRAPGAPAAAESPPLVAPEKMGLAGSLLFTSVDPSNNAARFAVVDLSGDFPAEPRMFQELPGVDAPWVLSPDFSKAVAPQPDGFVMIDLVAGTTTSLPVKGGSCVSWAPSSNRFAYAPLGTEQELRVWDLAGTSAAVTRAASASYVRDATGERLRLAGELTCGVWLGDSRIVLQRFNGVMPRQIVETVFKEDRTTVSDLTPGGAPAVKDLAARLYPDSACPSGKAATFLTANGNRQLSGNLANLDQVDLSPFREAADEVRSLPQPVRGLNMSYAQVGDVGIDDTTELSGKSPFRHDCMLFSYRYELAEDRISVSLTDPANFEVVEQWQVPWGHGENPRAAAWLDLPDRNLIAVQTENDQTWVVDLDEATVADIAMAGPGTPSIDSLLGVGLTLVGWRPGSPDS